MDYSPQVLRKSAEDGFKRLRNFRAARLLFIRAFCGQYYDREYGLVGSEPLNYAFNAVRALVPSLVARHPKATVETEYLIYRQYAELLALALNQLSKKIALPTILQRGLVDAFFTMGIFKIGLSTSDSLVYFGESPVDPGQLFVENVSLDNFTFDPTAKTLEPAGTGFIGERIRVERRLLMDSGVYDNAVIERLPSILDNEPGLQKEVRNLSSSNTAVQQVAKLHDYIDLLELWLPAANAIVTLPYKGSEPQAYLREEDYYGPNTGPYVFLSLTPDVPDNPIPVALAGIWHDLHVMANRIGKKTLDQAEAQKDILGYQSQFADDAQEIVNAKNLDAVKMDNPEAAKMFSFAGANPVNERVLAEIDLWFNRMSGNVNLAGGTDVNTNVATVANILQQNASTGITYMADRVYAAATTVLRNCAWYLHTDPLIRLPLIKRDIVPAQYGLIDGILTMVQPPKANETQVFLTPEVRNGDFLDFAFEIEQQSMAPVNWTVRLQQLEMLAVRLIPAAAQASQMMAQIGQPFSFRAFLTRAAKFLGFEWIDEIFQDPELLAYTMRLVQMGPQPQKGVVGSSATQQNRGAVVGRTSPSEDTRMRQTAQVGANEGQAVLPVRE
jgi:hypothetical protein